MSPRLPADLASRAAMLSLGSNIALMALKLTVGIITGSVAVLSDGIDSGQDVFASAIALAAVRFGMRPPDLTHPYGHGRAETLAALTQAFLIGGAAIYIVIRGAMRLANPPEQIGVDLSLAAMGITAVVNLAVLQYANRVARITDSPAIASDARHLWTNVVQAIAILAALALVALTGEVAFDALIALALAAYLLWTAGHILLHSLHDLLDANLEEEDLRFIEAAIMSHQDEIAGYHRLRTRRSGQRPYIDVHVVQPPGMTVAAAAAVAARIEESICSRWPDAVVTIQTEPDDGRFRGPLQSAESRGLEGERPKSRL